jgi:hypothetical protein
VGRRRLTSSSRVRAPAQHHQTKTMIANPHTAQIFAGQLIDGHFEDVFRIWDGDRRDVLPVKHMLERELPSLDFYWNTPD